MPTLPKLVSGLDLAGKVAPQSGGVPQVPSTAFGSDVFAASNEFGRAAQEAFKLIGRDNARTEAQNLANEMTSFGLDLTGSMGPNKDGSFDPNTGPVGTVGFNYLTGKLAMDHLDDYEKKAAEKRDEIMGRASGETKAMLAPTVNAAYANLVSSMRVRAHDQQTQWMGQVDKDTQALAVRSAVSGALAWNPSQEATAAPVMAAIADAGTKAGEIARRKLGNAPDAEKLVQAEVEGATTMAHLEVMKSLQTQDPARAEAWFIKNQKDMNPAMVAQYREELNNATRISRAQTFADQFNQAELATAAGQTKAYELARKNLSGKEEEAARNELDIRIGQATRARELRINEGTREVYTMIHSGKSPDEIFKARPDLLGVVGQNQYGLKSVYDAYAAVTQGKAFAPVSDGTTIHELLAKGPELANTELIPLKTKMTAPEWDKVNTAKSHYLSELQGDKGSSHLESYLKEIAPPNMNFDKDKASNEQRFQANMARSEMGIWFEQYKKEHNKFPGEQEKRDQAMRLMLKVQADPTNTGTLWRPKEGEESFSGKYGFQAKSMSQQQRDVARVAKSDIPQSLMLQIDQAVKAQKLPPSDDLREQLAGAVATGDRARFNRLLGVK